MRKKVFALVFAVLLMCCFTVCLSEEETRINLEGLGNFNLSAAEWFDDEVTRALLTFAVSIYAVDQDLGISIGPDDTAGNSYVGYDGSDTLMIVFKTTGTRAFCVVYSVGEEFGKCYFLPENTESSIEAFMSVAGMKYEMNTDSAKLQVARMFL